MLLLQLHAGYLYVPNWVVQLYGCCLIKFSEFASIFSVQNLKCVCNGLFSCMVKANGKWKKWKRTNFFPFFSPRWLYFQNEMNFKYQNSLLLNFPFMPHLFKPGHKLLFLDYQNPGSHFSSLWSYQNKWQWQLFLFSTDDNIHDIKYII